MHIDSSKTIEVISLELGVTNLKPY